MSAQVWIMADGTRIPIARMGDCHLGNTIAMLERRGWTNDPRYPQYGRLLREREARGLAHRAGVSTGVDVWTT